MTVVLDRYEAVYSGMVPGYLAGDYEPHLGFETRLIEAGEDSEAVECFELGYKILQIVFAVRECVQANTVFVIRRHIFQPDSVPPWLNWWQ